MTGLRNNSRRSVLTEAKRQFSIMQKWGVEGAKIDNLESFIKRQEELRAEKSEMFILKR